MNKKHLRKKEHGEEMCQSVGSKASWVQEAESGSGGCEEHLDRSCQIIYLITHQLGDLSLVPSFLLKEKPPGRAAVGKKETCP